MLGPVPVISPSWPFLPFLPRRTLKWWPLLPYSPRVCSWSAASDHVCPSTRFFTYWHLCFLTLSCNSLWSHSFLTWLHGTAITGELSTWYAHSGCQKPNCSSPHTVQHITTALHFPDLGLCKGLVHVADCWLSSNVLRTGYLPECMTALNQDHISQHPLHSEVMSPDQHSVRGIMQHLPGLLEESWCAHFISSSPSLSLSWNINVILDWG